jgi:hypothetical protein
MKNVIKYSTTLFWAVLMAISVNAQRYNNIYRAADADIIQEGSGNEHILKGATIILPNGSNRLNLALHIPYETFDSKPVDNSEFLSPGYQFNLKVNIDPIEIQRVLTSVKSFLTQGFLTLNGITKPVKVSYIPIESGADENGNFNIYMSIQFGAADFNLDVPDINTQFVLKINNAKVNRI